MADNSDMAIGEDDFTCRTCEGTQRVGDLGCWDCSTGLRTPTDQEFRAILAVVEAAEKAVGVPRTWDHDVEVALNNLRKQVSEYGGMPQ